MRVWDIILPALALAEIADAQGIKIAKILKKKPGLAKATNKPKPKVHTKSIAASITSHMKKIKPTDAPVSKNGAVGAKPKLLAAISDDCKVENIKFSYAPTPNVATQFLIDTFLASTSKAGNLYPAGYSTAFTNQYGSLSADGYLGYQQLSSYNVTACAAWCDSIDACQGFNIYFERAPTVNPGPNCRNPTANTDVRCVIWSGAVNATQAQNVGQWRSDFMVVIQGSNGYNKLPKPSSIDSFSSAIPLAGAVDTTKMIGVATAPWIASDFFPGTYDPKKCTDYCKTTTANNKKAAQVAGLLSYKACNYVNALDITLNDVSQGSYCQLYTTDVTNAAGLYNYTMYGTVFDLRKSYGYLLNDLDSGSLASTTSSTTTTSTTTTIGFTLPNVPTAAVVTTTRPATTTTTTTTTTLATTTTRR